MAFQAIVAPALVLCGALLYGSNSVVATGEADREELRLIRRSFSGPRVLVIRVRMLEMALAQIADQQSLKLVVTFSLHVRANAPKLPLSALLVAPSDLTQELLSGVYGC